MHNSSQGGVSSPDGINTHSHLRNWNLVAFQAVADQAPLFGLPDEITTQNAMGAERSHCCYMFPRQAIALASPRGVASKHAV